FPTICGSVIPPVNPTEEPIKPTEEPIKPTEEPVNPTEEPVKPTEEPIKPTEEPVKPTEEPIKPTEEPIKPTESSSEPIIATESLALDPTISSTPTNVPEPTNSKQPTEMIQSFESASESIFVPSPTVSGPLDDELSVDETVNFTGDSIELNKDGYKADNKEFSVTDKKADIILINPQEDVSLIKINTTAEKPEKSVFVSPSNKGTDAIILAPSDGTDYGQGEVGIHANSNLKNVILQTEKVPLNIYNNETTDVSIKLEKETNESTIYLNHLIMNNGSLQMKVPDEIQTIQFIVVEVYKLDKIETIRNKEQVETKIDELRLRSGSQLTLAKTNITKVIKASPRSKLVIEGRAAFNNETKIEMTESSFIDFGSSIVDGICNEIKLSENGTDINRLQEDETIIPLICGSNFDCPAWKDNYVGNMEFISAKCISYNNQQCLAATNKPITANRNSKNKALPTGTIIAIVIIVVIVVIAAILIVIILVKRKSNNYNYNNNEAHSQEIEDGIGNNESMNEISVNNGSTIPAEFENVLYNSADEHSISISNDPFLREFEETQA
ncbi:hypothetical protein M9Y10_038213, partial [Tritrichomonas musculus]